MLGSVMALCVLLLLPLWMGKIVPNSYYGYCTRFSRSSPQRWYRLNKLMAFLLTPFFGCLAISDLFLSEKQIVWILIPGTSVLFALVRLEEWRLQRREKRLAKKRAA